MAAEQPAEYLLGETRFGTRNVKIHRERYMANVTAGTSIHVVPEDPVSRAAGATRAAWRRTPRRYIRSHFNRESSAGSRKLQVHARTACGHRPYGEMTAITRIATDKGDGRIHMKQPAEHPVPIRKMHRDERPPPARVSHETDQPRRYPFMPRRAASMGGMPCSGDGV